MRTSDRKVRKLMEEYTKSGNLGLAALRADMDRKTARKYVKAGKLPSEMTGERTWRTREDPFAEVWFEAAEMLREAPDLEAKALFEFFCELHPDRYQEGQLRTFQRRVREWRALEGPEQEVFFPQEHEPGVRLETDFTGMKELGITICGEPFPHLLCHSVLAYSNWEWGTVCHSESLFALKQGVQATLFRLGRVPAEHWTDHSTAATHWIASENKKAREFNGEYVKFLEHFKMIPHTIQVKKPHENGDVESAHGSLKGRLKQHLLLRGDRDFDSVEAYVSFLEAVMEKGNRLRTERLAEELEVMRLLDVKLLPEYTTEEPRVSSWSTIQVAKRTYSVPSRLKGRKVKARIYDDRVEIYFHGVHQLSMPRLQGQEMHAINYRHIIGSLVRKPGAFRRYKYHTDLFPTETFRWAYDALCDSCPNRTADKEYLRILNHAAQTMETTVEKALATIKGAGEIPRWETVLKVTEPTRPELPTLSPLTVDLAAYDELLLDGEVSE